MTGSVCEREDLMDGSVIPIHTGRAGKWCRHSPGLGKHKPTDLDIQLHTSFIHTHTPVQCNGILWLKCLMYLMNYNENSENDFGISWSFSPLKI